MRMIPDEYAKQAFSWAYTVYSSIYIKSLKWQNYRNGKQISGCPRLRISRRNVTTQSRLRDVFSVSLLERHGGYRNLHTIKWQECYICIVQMLVSRLLHYSYERCKHWGKLDKGYVLFLQLLGIFILRSKVKRHPFYWYNTHIRKCRYP